MTEKQIVVSICLLRIESLKNMMSRRIEQIFESYDNPVSRSVAITDLIAKIDLNCTELEVDND